MSRTSKAAAGPTTEIAVGICGTSTGARAVGFEVAGKARALTPKSAREVALFLERGAALASETTPIDLVTPERVSVRLTKERAICVAALLRQMADLLDPAGASS